jgi:phosphonate transport system ATP-binding protein
MEILLKLNREEGITVVVSLHQVDFARRYCPRAVALASGRILYDGPSKNLSSALLREIYHSESKDRFVEEESETFGETDYEGETGVKGICEMGQMN